MVDWILESSHHGRYPTIYSWQNKLHKTANIGGKVYNTVNNSSRAQAIKQQKTLIKKPVLLTAKIGHPAPYDI